MLFKTVISPCDKEYNRKRLKEIIYSIKGFKKSKSDNWSMGILFGYERSVFGII